MRTFDKKDVYSWANCNELRLATYGYVGNSLHDLACNIAPEGKVQLLSIDEDSALCFNVENKQDDLAKVYHFAFFLPADKVKYVEEKKYRPFKSFNEFNVVTNKSVGDLINYRLKNSTDFYCAVITKTFCSPNLDPTIDFGNSCFKYTELFNNFLWLDSENTWKPFGVAE